MSVLLKRTYEAHNALVDVKALKDLHHDQATSAELSQHCYTCISVVERENIVRDGKTNIESLNVLLTENTNIKGKSKSYASKQTVTKIGESGLSLKHLELSFKQAGFEGLLSLLSELNSLGKPRVTRLKMIIEKIAAYFERQNPNVE